MVELAIGWLAKRPAIALVICGATSGAQVIANVAGADWMPDAALFARLGWAGCGAL